MKKSQHTKSTPKRKRQTPYVYLSREALDELGWYVDMPVKVIYDPKTSLITIRDSSGNGKVFTATIAKPQGGGDHESEKYKEAKKEKEVVEQPKENRSRKIFHKR